jgi:hypothetical protein
MYWVPIDRVGGTASETALDAGPEVLRQGGEPLHFSCREGLSPDEELRRVTDEAANLGRYIWGRR